MKITSENRMDKTATCSQYLKNTDCDDWLDFEVNVAPMEGLPCWVYNTSEVSFGPKKQSQSNNEVHLLNKT